MFDPDTSATEGVLMPVSWFRFDEAALSFLNGSTFDASAAIRIAGSGQPLVARADLLVELVRGQKVLHVGCCDHVPLIKDRIAAGEWLHKRLSESAAVCLGMDIDEAAVSYVRGECAVSNVIHFDLLEGAMPDELSRERWDWLVLGEILEHVDDPVRFLTSLRERLAGRVDKIIVTVPNAFNSVNRKYALRQIERINSDHRYWFTPYTLAKVATRAGLRVDGFTFCPYRPISRGRFYQRLRLRIYPALRDCLVMVLRASELERTR